MGELSPHTRSIRDKAGPDLSLPSLLALRGAFSQSELAHAPERALELLGTMQSHRADGSADLAATLERAIERLKAFPREARRRAARPHEMIPRPESSASSAARNVSDTPIDFALDRAFNFSFKHPEVTSEEFYARINLDRVHVLGNQFLYEVIAGHLQHVDREFTLATFDQSIRVEMHRQLWQFCCLRSKEDALYRSLLEFSQGEVVEYAISLLESFSRACDDLELLMMLGRNVIGESTIIRTIAAHASPSDFESEAATLIAKVREEEESLAAHLNDALARVISESRRMQLVGSEVVSIAQDLHKRFPGQLVVEPTEIRLIRFSALNDEQLDGRIELYHALRESQIRVPGSLEMERSGGLFPSESQDEMKAHARRKGAYAIELYGPTEEMVGYSIGFSDSKELPPTLVGVAQQFQRIARVGCIKEIALSERAKGQGLLRAVFSAHEIAVAGKIDTLAGVVHIGNTRAQNAYFLRDYLTYPLDTYAARDHKSTERDSKRPGLFLRIARPINVLWRERAYRTTDATEMWESTRIKARECLDTVAEVLPLWPRTVTLPENGPIPLQQIALVPGAYEIVGLSGQLERARAQLAIVHTRLKEMEACLLEEYFAYRGGREVFHSRQLKAAGTDEQRVKFQRVLHLHAEISAKVEDCFERIHDETRNARAVGEGLLQINSDYRRFVLELSQLQWWFAPQRSFSEDRRSSPVGGVEEVLADLSLLQSVCVKEIYKRWSAAVGPDTSARGVDAVLGLIKSGTATRLGPTEIEAMHAELFPPEFRREMESLNLVLTQLASVVYLSANGRIVSNAPRVTLVPKDEAEKARQAAEYVVRPDAMRSQTYRNTTYSGKLELSCARVTPDGRPIGPICFTAELGDFVDYDTTFVRGIELLRHEIKERSGADLDLSEVEVFVDFPSPSPGARFTLSAFHSARNTFLTSDMNSAILTAVGLDRPRHHGSGIALDKFRFVGGPVYDEGRSEDMVGQERQRAYGIESVPLFDPARMLSHRYPAGEFGAEELDAGIDCILNERPNITVEGYSWLELESTTSGVVIAVPPLLKHDSDLRSDLKAALDSARDGEIRIRIGVPTREGQGPLLPIVYVECLSGVPEVLRPILESLRRNRVPGFYRSGTDTRSIIVDYIPGLEDFSAQHRSLLDVVAFDRARIQRLVGAALGGNHWVYFPPLVCDTYVRAGGTCLPDPVLEHMAELQRFSTPALREYLARDREEIPLSDHFPIEDFFRGERVTRSVGQLVVTENGLMTALYNLTHRGEYIRQRIVPTESEDLRSARVTQSMVAKRIICELDNRGTIPLAVAHSLRGPALRALEPTVIVPMKHQSTRGTFLKSLFSPVEITPTADAQMIIDRMTARLFRLCGPFLQYHLIEPGFLAERLEFLHRHVEFKQKSRTKQKSLLVDSDHTPRNTLARINSWINTLPPSERPRIRNFCESSSALTPRIKDRAGNTVGHALVLFDSLTGGASRGLAISDSVSGVLAGHAIVNDGLPVASLQWFEAQSAASGRALLGRILIELAVRDIKTLFIH